MNNAMRKELERIGKAFEGIGAEMVGFAFRQQCIDRQLFTVSLEKCEKSRGLKLAETLYPFDGLLYAASAWSPGDRTITWLVPASVLKIWERKPDPVESATTGPVVEETEKAENTVKAGPKKSKKKKNEVKNG